MDSSLTKELAMTRTERAHALIELQKEQLEAYHQKRNLEVKVNLALWTAIAAVGAFLFEKYQLPSCFIAILVPLAITACHVFLWLMPLQRARHVDDGYVVAYRHRIEDLVGGRIELSEKYRTDLSPLGSRIWETVRWVREKAWPALIFEGVFTFILSLTVALLLWATPEKADKTAEFAKKLTAVEDRVADLEKLSR